MLKVLDLPDSFLVAWEMSYEQYTYVQKNGPVRSNICCCNVTCQFQSWEKRKGHKRGDALSCKHLSFYLQVRKTELISLSIKENCIDSQKFRAVRLWAMAGYRGLKRSSFHLLVLSSALTDLAPGPTSSLVANGPRALQAGRSLVLAISKAEGVFWYHYGGRGSLYSNKITQRLISINKIKMWLQ